MTDTKKTIIGVIVAILIIDVYCWCFWKVSEQTPTDWQHTGIITEFIINLVK